MAGARDHLDESPDGLPRAERDGGTSGDPFGRNEHACLSHYERGLHADRAAWKRQSKRAPARVQGAPSAMCA